MPTNVGTLEALGREVATALQPLELLLEGGRAGSLLAELGVRPPDAVLAVPGLAGALGNGAAAAAGLLEPLKQLAEAVASEDVGGIVAAGRVLFTRVKAVLDTLPALSSALDQAAGAAAGVDEDTRHALRELAAVLPRRVLDLVLVEYLAERAPELLATMELLALVDRVREPGTAGDPFRPPYVRRTLHLDRISALASDPERYFHDAYGWGADVFDGTALLGRLQAYLAATGMDAALIQAPGHPAILDAFLLMLRASPPEAPNGLEARLRVSGAGGTERLYPLGDGRWTLRTASQGEVEGGVRAVFRPPFSVDLQPEGALRADAFLGVKGGTAADPLMLFGQPGASRVQADEVSAGIALRLEKDLAGRIKGGPEVRAAVRGGRIVIDPGSDGFLGSLLGGGRLETEVHLALAWSPEAGLRFEGGAGAELAVPTSVNLGPVLLRELYFALGVSEGGVETQVAASLTAALGPLRASVDRIGLTAGLTFPGDGSGNLGAADLDLGFRGPSGVSLELSGGPISGGGFLFSEPGKGRYAGAMVLEMEGIGLKAVGLLDTRHPDGTRIRMPDGSDGFSLLVIISAEFTPMQLGMGFTLNGVGGLIAIHRTVSLEALREGVRNRALDAVLFPPDPLGQAGQLVSTLGRLFPVSVGRHVFGPMARIGWGTPTLIEGDLGLLLEVPQPVRLTVLGRIRVALPDPSKPVIRLNLDSVGTLDFDKGALAVDATLYDSQIAGLTLSGDMAMRVNWGDRPAFALSIGGFHPSFSPPAGFPALRRLTLALGNSDNPRVTLQAYFAMTSNTVQFGARLDLYAGVGPVSVRGMFTFDALIGWDPFGVQLDIAAMVGAFWDDDEILSIRLELHVSGPQPWIIRGKAVFTILLFDVEIPVDLRIGRPGSRPRPAAIPVVNRVRAALADPRNWAAQQPPVGETLVTLREVVPAPGVLLAHPLGELRVSQREAPLGVELDHYGQAPVDGARSVSITGARVHGVPVAPAAVTDFFARAEFLALSEEEKLAAPSFESFASGAKLDPDPAVVRFGAAAAWRPSALTFEEHVLDVAVPVPPASVSVDGDGDAAARLAAAPESPGETAPAEPARLTADSLERLLHTGPAATRSPRQTGPDRFAGPSLGLELLDPRYAVLDGTADGTTYATFTAAARAARRAADGAGTPAAAPAVVAAAAEATS